MRFACPDNLLYGIECRTPKECEGMHSLCPLLVKSPHVSNTGRARPSHLSLSLSLECKAVLTTFNRKIKICPNDQFRHESDHFGHKYGDGHVFHIKPTCESIQLDLPCVEGDRCELGHDFPSVRRDVYRRRTRQAARDYVRNERRINQLRNSDPRVRAWNDFEG